MNGKSGYWDHKTKPSMFVVTDDGKEVFRGNFTEGYKLLNKTRKTFVESIAKYFKEPDLLTPKISKK